MNKKGLKIHITGASGSGTTTLGRAISEKYGIKHFDTDDFYWEKTKIPFTVKRDRGEAAELMKKNLESNDSWVISGSLCEWGDFTVKYYDFIIFLYLDQEIRIKRLREREIKSFGKKAISKGGKMYENNRKFFEWAKKYDTAGLDIRSLKRHEAWLKKSNLPVLRIEGEVTIEEKLKLVDNYLIENNLI